MEIHRLEISNGKEKHFAYLGLSSLDCNALFINRKEYLSNAELGIFKQFKFEKRKKDFLQSRHLAKSMLSIYLEESDLSKIIIESGIFQQPLVKYCTNRMPVISISHTHNYSVCFVTSAKYSAGIDIEYISNESKENILSQTTTRERTYLNDKENENDFYTKVWTVKEALSKVLKTGIMSPFEIYEIENIIPNGKHSICTFKNFNQYKALSFKRKNYFISFVLPTTCTILNQTTSSNEYINLRN